MPGIHEFGMKIAAVCGHNRGAAHTAPTRKTELLDWLDLSGGRMSRFYKPAKPDVPAVIERAVVMALGFGPVDASFEKGWDQAWMSWLADWKAVWREGSPTGLVERLELTNCFVPRLHSDKWLQFAKSRIPRRMRDSAQTGSYVSPVTPPTGDHDCSSDRPERYLHPWLASLRAACVKTLMDSELAVDMSFGLVDVIANELTYNVALDRCRVEVLFDEASFLPTLDEDTVGGDTTLSEPVHITRETSRVNYPSWLLENPAPKTPLRGEYRHLSLGRVNGTMLPSDEARFLVSRSQFAITDGQHKPLPLGIVSSIINDLITEHVGESKSAGRVLILEPPT